MASRPSSSATVATPDPTTRRHSPANSRHPTPTTTRHDRTVPRGVFAVLQEGRKSCCGGPGRRPRTLPKIRERMTYARRGGEPFAKPPRTARHAVDE
ncbi:hypothetical protein C1I97_17340 [Streptomyces sp. NTH33]|nr:hypothetical protein C1I97_17340 [Streptomyces sp. NTH33]